MSYRMRRRNRPIILLCLVAAGIVGGVVVCYTRQGPAADGFPFGTTDATGEPVPRSSPAGTWYPADAAELREEIAGYFAQASVEPRADVVGLVLPHGDYAYSGPTAAQGIQSLGRNYRRIVVIGPTHHLPMEDTFSVPRETYCETPLGRVPLDVEFIRTLLQYPLFQHIPTAHHGEHSVEIVLPLLQYKLGDFQLVPIVAGNCSSEVAAQAGRILASLIDADTLVIASSDFTHHGPQHRFAPFDEDIPENVQKLDMTAFEFIRKLDGEGLLEYRNRTGVTMCGSVPIAVLLAMLDGDTQVDLLQYTTSGEVTGDYSNSVSYLAISFQGAWEAVTTPEVPAASPVLTAEDKEQLLALARRTLRYALDHQMMPEPAELDFVASESIKMPRAAFVSIERDGQFRGSAGDAFPLRPLHRSVIANTIYAAFADQRFPQLSDNEYDRIRIEISALTAPRPVTSPQEIRIGIDGVILLMGDHVAAFMPRMALEQGWDREMMLRQLSQEAGLPADVWKQGASLLVFQAEVFGEQP